MSHVHPRSVAFFRSGKAAPFSQPQRFYYVAFF